VRFDDRPANRQPHPHAAGFRGVEGIEDAIDMFQINPRDALRQANLSQKGMTCTVVMKEGAAPTVGLAWGQRCENFY
jgi:hypothetical protein